MEFGRVYNIDTIDFGLPPDHSYNSKIFKNLKKQSEPHIYVGCAKWGRPDWIGKLYPKGTKATDFLKHYTSHFNSIELNAMFYQTFPVSVTEKWASQADDNFRFCPKFPQAISHIKRLKNTEVETDKYLESLMGFGNKLGYCFLQFDEHFGVKHFNELKNYLDKLPPELSLAVEFRHADWFKETEVVDHMHQLFIEKGIATVITDTSGRRDVLHMRLTAPVAFVRYVGNNLHLTDFARIDEWVNRIKQWLNSGLHTLYFFIHNHEELNSPELCHYFISKINQECGLSIPKPNLLKNNLLF
jgi:uncharacterized protein YecE (DUF72 family)